MPDTIETPYTNYDVEIGEPDDYVEFGPTGGEQVSARLVRFFKKNNILKIIITLYGGGDSGCGELGLVMFNDKKISYSQLDCLSEIMMVSNEFAITTVGDFLIRAAEDLPEENWTDGNGGCGDVTFIVFPDSDKLLCSYYINDNEEEYESDFEDDLEDEGDGLSVLVDNSETNSGNVSVIDATYDEDKNNTSIPARMR